MTQRARPRAAVRPCWRCSGEEDRPVCPRKVTCDMDCGMRQPVSALHGGYLGFMIRVAWTAGSSTVGQSARPATLASYTRARAVGLGVRYSASLPGALASVEWQIRNLPGRDPTNLLPNSQKFLNMHLPLASKLIVSIVKGSLPRTHVAPSMPKANKTPAALCTLDKGVTDTGACRLAGRLNSRIATIHILLSDYPEPANHDTCLACPLDLGDATRRGYSLISVHTSRDRGPLFVLRLYVHLRFARTDSRAHNDPPHDTPR